MSKATERIDRHDRLYRIYRDAEAYADLLDAAGNCNGAEVVREHCRAVACNNDLDFVLKGDLRGS